MIRNIFLMVSLFMFSCCKNDRITTEREAYRYDESILAYSFDIYSKNEINRIAFLLNQKNKLITIMLYRKDENYKNIIIPIHENEVKKFIKILNKQLTIDTIFNNKNDNKDGYEIVFFIDAGGGSISANYLNIINISDDISLDFDQLLMSLRKVEEVNYFFIQTK